MASGRFRNLPVDYATGIARAMQPNIFFKPVNPLVVREELRESFGGANLGPRKRALGAP
jgi:hypothetical protein